MFELDDLICHSLDIVDPDTGQKLVATFAMRGRWELVGYTQGLEEEKEKWLIQEAKKEMKKLFGRDSIL